MIRQSSNFESLRLSDFDFHVPEELVAQRPLEERDASRMMVVNRHSGRIEHRHFRDLPEYLDQNDYLVFNKTKVVKARLVGQREGTGGKVEIFLLRKISAHRYECLVKATAAQKVGLSVKFGDEMTAKILPETETPMIYEVEFTAHSKTIEHWIDRYGRVPLPPYIHREADGLDIGRYQTVFAEEPGSVAAPTAGLHFTPQVLEAFKTKGIQKREVILHVGLGTFQPIKLEEINQHKMHREEFIVSEQFLKECETRKENHKRVVAVGTTTVRALESAARGFTGSTEIFLKPGDEFRYVDALFTNFHQPKSSLVVMLAGFMGNMELWREAYAKAVEEKYRFFSYGDCMLVT